LANLFLHYAFDRWMAEHYPQAPFERYADDAIVHCRKEAQAQEIRNAIAVRLKECGLELHPEKTKLVYCKDDLRRRTYPNEKFDFLGYTFRPRRSKNRAGKHFINFSPAVSDKAVKAIRAEIRSWDLPERSDKQIEDLSRMFNPVIRGWLQYYGRYYRSALYPSMRQLDRSLARWAYRKYKKLRGHLRRATHWIARIARRDPTLFAHGKWVRGVAPWREPYELRGSCTVLRERRGETPRRYSPGDTQPRVRGGGAGLDAEGDNTDWADSERSEDQHQAGAQGTV
jgi:RNA-directed DNA polymerase